MCSMTKVATNLDLDPELLDRAFKVSGKASKKAAVTEALEEYVKRRDRRAILDIAGTLEWDPTYDYKAHR